jgi:hypothetical protein
VSPALDQIRLDSSPSELAIAVPSSSATKSVAQGEKPCKSPARGIVPSSVPSVRQGQIGGSFDCAVK